MQYHWQASVMITDQKGAIPGVGGPQDHFLYFSAPIRPILKAKPVWHIAGVEDAASSSPLHEEQASDAGPTQVVMLSIRRV